MDMSNLFGKMKEMQAKMKEAQESLEHVTAEGSAGGDMVKVVVNGKKKVLSIDIEEPLLNKDDKQMLQDLIVAATNKALEEVEAKAAETLKKSTEGFMPNIPGLDLSKMF
ncbi:MAG TPA: DNA-binding protein [Cytophagales bacterium]|jgi:DNA-binding YbaB/EbfC family protein|nr:DNA-binding protein [Cytophagales bacterium]